MPNEFKSCTPYVHPCSQCVASASPWCMFGNGGRVVTAASCSIYHADDDDDVDTHEEGFPPFTFVTAHVPTRVHGPIWARHCRRRVFVSCAPPVAGAPVRANRNPRPFRAGVQHACFNACTGGTGRAFKSFISLDLPLRRVDGGGKPRGDTTRQRSNANGTLLHRSSRDVVALSQNGYGCCC